MATEHIRCPPPEADSPYDIVHFLCGDKDKPELSVMCYDKRFEILALAKILDSLITLEEYYNAQTIHLTIQVIDGKLTGTQSPHEPQDLKPHIQLADAIMSVEVRCLPSFQSEIALGYRE
ncbi:hypothetical protein CIHG_00426 [Coccidioides immitis H538.4]|uniref:Uncharacterized protein n=3 Tax=Coccidioides immitis TaxID=5501 RepID=A0A0J8QL96_COCIT|nr:hypothetical protein CIRG_07243 [Coccidioides immitis RMSCC 2394]KMU71988.1 hypothetical protein CISG_00297 [Coccidioides immitis RMSCC 3703]KMU82645.1 hypothetical protein CIHG_00426 [Coccidioides immitis H538.4]